MSAHSSWLATLVVCALLMAGCAGSMSSTLPLEQAAVFAPSKFPAGNWRPEGIRVQDAWFTADDGTKLHGWYIAKDRSSPGWGVALFAHGNGGNVTDWVYAAAQLSDSMNWSVLVFDYRGYGRSQGEPNEEGLYQDARAARNWLAAHEHLPPRHVVLVGCSLGGGVVTHLAAEHGARALILQSTFTSVPDVASRHLPLLPVRAMMHNRFDNIAKIARYDGPVFIAHGDGDRLIPLSHARRLHDAASGPKELFVVRDGDHNSPLPEEYYHRLREFFQRHVPAPPPELVVPTIGPTKSPRRPTSIGHRTL